jgi:site-specific recombinase XerD
MVRRAEQTGVWEAMPDVVVAPTVGITIEDSVKAFLTHCEATSGANLQAPTISKYRTAVERLTDWCDESGYTHISEIDQSVLVAFKDSWAEWAISPQTTANYITRLKVFGEWLVERDYWPQNFAKKLKNPKNYEHTERQPFTDEQMEAILQTARTVELDVQQPVSNEDLETFILMMRHAGMAIGDVALLEKSEIVGDEVRYYRNKTRRQKSRILVIVPLPKWLLDRLKQIELKQGEYYFCYGSDHLVSACSGWHKRLRQVFDAVGISRCESHRFRHTFATKMLTRKVALPGGGHGYIPVSVVARWLGHNEKTTIKYYSHWIKERQELASDLMRAVLTEDAANGVRV